MDLSKRAQSYLSTLRRGGYLPIERVAAVFNEAQVELNDIWHEFHSKYAGYEEPLGNELAVWGLVHTDPFWLGPHEIVVEYDAPRWRIVCADVHPSFEYWLYSDGEFSSNGGGGCCESFEFKIERASLVHEALADGRAWEFSFDLVQTAGGVGDLCKLVDAELVVEASDKFARSWRAPGLIVIEDRTAKEDERSASVWVTSEARARVLQQVRRAG